MGNSGISRPDIILRNSLGFFNYAITEGELTTSDHIPVLFTISTASVMKVNTPRKLYNETNWDSVKEKLTIDITNMKQRMNLIQNHRNIDKVTIDEEVRNWTEVVKRRIDDDTPQKLFNVFHILRTQTT